MRWKKSMVGMEILGTKDSGHHEVVACPRKLRYKKSSSRQDVNIESSRSIVYRERSAKPIFYITSLPLSLLLRLSKDKRRLSEMEHFGDHEEQTSISIDQNEIPISDSEDDSISSSVFEEVGIFKSIGLTKIAEGDQCYEMIKGYLTYGMGKDSNVAPVHEVPWSGPNGRGRLEAFHVPSAEMVTSRGGNGNVKYAWYGGSRDELCGIVSHGFRRCRQSDNEDGFGIYLYPLELVMDGVLSSITDDYGLRHVLLCSVVLGKLEEVSTGSRKFQPSSNDFDSGVDNLSTPTRFVIWEAYMNSQIFPSFIVSFRPPNNRGFGKARTPVRKPTLGFDVVIPKLSSVLHSSKMALIDKYLSAFREKKISRAQLVHRTRQVAGDNLLSDVIKSCMNEVWRLHYRRLREEQDHKLQQN